MITIRVPTKNLAKISAAKRLPLLTRLIASETTAMAGEA